MSGEVNPWRDAVLHELAVAHSLLSSHESNPRKAVQDAISWNVQVALDPLVSSDAKALMERGRREGLLEAIRRLNQSPYSLTKAECVDMLSAMRVT